MPEEFEAIIDLYRVKSIPSARQISTKPLLFGVHDLPAMSAPATGGLLMNGHLKSQDTITEERLTKALTGPADPADLAIGHNSAGHGW